MRSFTHSTLVECLHMYSISQGTDCEKATDYYSVREMARRRLEVAIMQKRNSSHNVVSVGRVRSRDAFWRKGA